MSDLNFARFARRRWWELGCALGVVGLAVWLRLRELGLVEFKSDEAIAVGLARRLLHGELPTVGLESSVGALNPPLFVYLTAIPLSVRDDPLAATAFMGVLAVVAVALTYVVLRPRFGALAALAAAALLATGPWAVLYGRKIWAVDPLPLFTVSLLWSLFAVLERPRSRAVLLVPVLLCITFQLDFSALALVIPVGVLLLYRARALHWPAFAVGVGLAVLLLAPWLGHEATHGFADVSELVKGGRGNPGGALPGSGSVEAIRQTIRLLGAGNWDYVLGGSHAQFVHDAGAAWTLGRAAGLLVAALFGVGVLTCTVHIVRGARLSRRLPFVELNTDGGRRALLLVWLGGIWLSYAASASSRVHPHYLTVAYPVSFAVAALGLTGLIAPATGRIRRAATATAVAALVAVLAGFVAFTLSFHRFLDEHGGTAGDYWVVYEDSAALADAVRARGLRVDDRVLDFLVTGQLNEPFATPQLVPVRYAFLDPAPLPCTGELRTFGALSACLPPALG